VLPVDVDVQAVQPHAHYRAREVRATATLPDGTATPLIYIKDWDYRWQHVYRYVTPVMLPKGTRIEATGVFDNSPNNRWNPDPKSLVRWGDQSWEEMMVGFVEVAFDAKLDIQQLVGEVKPRN